MCFALYTHGSKSSLSSVPIAGFSLIGTLSNRTTTIRELKLRQTVEIGCLREHLRRGVHHRAQDSL